MKVSVVIPVLNERACLPATLDSIREAIPEADTVVSDGGSIDGSIEWLQNRKDIRLVVSARGKGPQQNSGAAIATGQTLLFLHADCQLPRDAGERLARALRDPRKVGGCFFVRFAEHRPLSLHILACGMNARSSILRRSFGDQALFIRKSTFDEIGGFPDWPLFEDYELVRKMKKAGRFAVITSPVTISARRFLARGVWFTIAHVFLLQAGYYLGIAPTRLKQWFEDIRPHLGQTPLSRGNPIQSECCGGDDVHRKTE